MRRSSRRGRQVHLLNSLIGWPGSHSTQRLPAESKSARPASRRILNPDPSPRSGCTGDPAVGDSCLRGCGLDFCPSILRRAPDANSRRANVYIGSSGRMAVEARATRTVQFRNETSKTNADEFLNEHGCRVLENMSFAPGLFRGRTYRAGPRRCPGHRRGVAAFQCHRIR